MKETALQKQILDYLRLKGYIAVKFRSVGIYNKKTDKYIPVPAGERGVSDILFWGKDKAGAIEVKMKGRKPTKAQLDFIERMQKLSYTAFVAYSLKEVQEKLRCPNLMK